MSVAEPVATSWKAKLVLGFASRDGRSTLARREQDGPLVVQKPLYPEGSAVCHAIIVHPPGGIAGGDELALHVDCPSGAHALLTTPGAGKWYRSAGAAAAQSLDFRVGGTLEWLPRETIVFDGALAELSAHVRLECGARFIGWEVVCLGRRGAGERYGRGRLTLSTRIERDDRVLFAERGEIAAAGALMRSAAGLGGRSVFGTFIATGDALAADARTAVPALGLTQLPGLLIGRYLGDSSEEALHTFCALWQHVRPLIAGRAAVEPRIWST